MDESSETAKSGAETWKKGNHRNAVVVFTMTILVVAAVVAFIYVQSAQLSMSNDVDPVDLASRLGEKSDAPEKERMKVIIDGDPGIDDAYAILLALESDRFDIVGCTSIYGNVEASTGAENFLNIFDVSYQDTTQIPVYEGSSHPLVIKMRDIPYDIMGDDGLGNIFYERSNLDQNPIKDMAIEWMVSTVLASPQEITIVAIGPLTNIAKAVTRDVTFASKVKQLVIMGGAVRVPGNVNPGAEANIWEDPLAADIVFSTHWASPMVMVPLDVTMKIGTKMEMFDEVAVSKPNVGHFLRDIHLFYEEFYTSIGFDTSSNGSPTHDTSAILYLLEPQLFTTEAMRIGVRLYEGDELKGSTVELPEKDHIGAPLRPEVLACIDVSEQAGEKILEHFLN